MLSQLALSGFTARQLSSVLPADLEGGSSQFVQTSWLGVSRPALQSHPQPAHVAPECLVNPGSSTCCGAALAEEWAVSEAAKRSPPFSEAGEPKEGGGRRRSQATACHSQLGPCKRFSPRFCGGRRSSPSKARASPRGREKAVSHRLGNAGQRDAFSLTGAQFPDGAAGLRQLSQLAGQ